MGVDINGMVWDMGVGMGAILIDLIYLSMTFYAYDAAAAKCRTADGAAATLAGCAVQADMKREWIVFFGTQGFVINMLLPHMTAWRYGQYMALNKSDDAAALF